MLSPELQQWGLRHDRPGSVDTVSARAAAGRERLSAPRSPRTVERKTRISAPCARPLFGAPTLAKSHARLSYGFTPILRLRVYHQGQLTSETAFSRLREE